MTGRGKDRIGEEREEREKRERERRDVQYSPRPEISSVAPSFVWSLEAMVLEQSRIAVIASADWMKSWYFEPT